MRRILAVLVLISLATPALAGPYLFELLQIKGYRKGFDAMLAHERHLPAWVTTFARTMNGVAGPSEDITVNGALDVFATVCKPHDCGGNMLYVIFANGGDPAWGLLEETGLNGKTKTRLLGRPDRAMAEALRMKAAGD
jgi:hypothetical protein